MSSNKNIEKIINRFGRDYKSGGKNEIRYNCPFCKTRRGKEDHDGKLYVNIHSLKFICFKCNARGKLSKKLDSSYEIYNRLIDYVSDSDMDDTDDSNVFYVPNIPIPKNSLAYEYCISRGIDDDKIKFYNIRLGTEELFGRIVIPNILFEDSGIWTDMFSSRTYIDQTPKYKNPRDCKKTNSVFNLHNIKEGCEDLYVVEGAITAIHAGRDAVAVYGCHPSDAQINAILDKDPKNLYCVLDNDEAGRRPNELLAETFSKRRDSGNVYLVYMPPGKDAADMGETKFKEYVLENRILYHSSVYTNIVSYFKE